MSIEVKKDSNDLLEARKKYFFVGDSHMAGILGAGPTVNNNDALALGGKQTKDMLQALEPSKLNSRPLVLLGGTNDIGSSRTANEAFNNLQTIIKKSGAKKVFLGTIPPIGSKWFLKHPELNKDSILKNVQELNAKITSLQIPGVDISIIPVYQELQEGWESTSPDGIHSPTLLPRVFSRYIDLGKNERVSEQKSLSFPIRLQKIFGEDLSRLPTVELRKKLEEQKQRTSVNQQSQKELDELLQVVKRRENREVKFGELAAKNPEKFKGKTIDDISVRDLYESDQNDGGFLSRTFAFKTDKSTGDQKPFEKNTASEGDEILIDFGGNEKANHTIGSGDILPSTVRVIKIIDDKGVMRIGTRETNKGRYGYYDGDTYLRIYTGYKIIIPDDKEVQVIASKKREESPTSTFPLTACITSAEAEKYKPDENKNKDSFFQQLKSRDELLARLGTMQYGGTNPYYGSNGEISDTTKILKDLDITETNDLLRKIFGNGPATELLIQLDAGSTFLIKREIAIAYHEKRFQFGTMNQAVIKRNGELVRGPDTGMDIGTYQIHGGSEEDAKNRYAKFLIHGMKMASEEKISIGDIEKLEPAQKDLLCHIGYIDLERGGQSTFARLRDSNLSNDEAVKLVSTTVQGGIDNIGKDVINQLKTVKIATNKLSNQDTRVA